MTTEVTEADLPELPAGWDRTNKSPWKEICQWADADPGLNASRTADDVSKAIADFAKSHALAAVAASRKKLMEQKPATNAEPTIWRSWSDKDGYGYWDSYQEALVYCAEDCEPVRYEAAPMPQANESEAVKALQELVECKRIKDRAEALHFAGPLSDLGEGWKAEYDRLRADYIKRQPLAWEAARAVLAGEHEAAGEQPKHDWQTLAESALELVEITQRSAERRKKYGLDEQPEQEQATNENIQKDILNWMGAHGVVMMPPAFASICDLLEKRNAPHPVQNTRKLFERWAESKSYDLTYTDGDTFFVPRTQEAWEAWQGCVSLFQTYPHDGQWLYDICTQTLAALGHPDSVPEELPVLARQATRSVPITTEQWIDANVSGNPVLIQAMKNIARAIEDEKK